MLVETLCGPANHMV